MVVTISRAVASVMLLAAAMVTTAGADWNVEAMNRVVDQTNFLVNDNCSATLIDRERGYFLTANHCITDQFRVIEREKIGDDGVIKKENVRVAKPGTVSQIAFSGFDEEKRTSYVFKIKLNDADLDLALLQVGAKLPNTMSAKIACRDPSRGDTSYAVGNSGGVLYATVTKGIISSTSRNYSMIGVTEQGSHGLIQSSAPIIGGNSGGAEYNDKGEMIGVLVRASRINETFSFAVPLVDIKRFLTREGLNDLWKDCDGKSN